jgi:hypothetical protein
MNTVILYHHADRTVRALDAARRFAETHWQEPRQVGNLRHVEGAPASLDFQLIDGQCWYRVTPASHGWNVSLIVPHDVIAPHDPS